MHNSWDKFHIQSQYIHVFKIYPIFLSKPLTLRLCMPANNIDVTSEYPVRAICQEINSLFSRVVTRTVAYLLYDYLHTRRNIFSLFFFICLSNIYSITSFLLYLNWYFFFLPRLLFHQFMQLLIFECQICRSVSLFSEWTNWIIRQVYIIFSAIHKCISSKRNFSSSCNEISKLNVRWTLNQIFSIHECRFMILELHLKHALKFDSKHF